MKSMLVFLIPFLLLACGNNPSPPIPKPPAQAVRDTIPIDSFYRVAWMDGFDAGSMNDEVWTDSMKLRFYESDSTAFFIQYRDIYLRPPVEPPIMDVPEDSLWYYYPIDTIEWITPDSFILKPAWNKRE